MKTLLLLAVVLLGTTGYASDQFDTDEEDVIYDSRTGLSWFCLGWNGRTDVEGALNRIQSLNRQRVPAGENWRLPTLDELEYLYYDAGITDDDPGPFAFVYHTASQFDERATLWTKVFCEDAGDYLTLNFKTSTVGNADYSAWPGDCITIWAVR